MTHTRTTRRSLLLRGGALLAAGATLAAAPASWSAPAALAKPTPALLTALAASPVVYLTPLRRNGSESRCHAEVWFVARGATVYVVTANTAWRATAIGQGMNRARLWAGDFGNWKQAGGKFRAAPGFVASGARVTDAKEIDQALDLYGSKYRVQWLLWSGRFHNGLKDGSRVMLRYTQA